MEKCHKFAFVPHCMGNCCYWYLQSVAFRLILTQNKAVTGVVTSATDNEPLIGVSVQVKETATGGITDIDGKFSVNAEQGQTLIFRISVIKPRKFRLVLHPLSTWF